MKKLILIFLSLLFLLGLQAQDAKIEAFDKYIEESRQKFQVPGCAVVVVKDGEVLFSKGYGKPSIDSEEKVNTETLFGMMSTTKATTAVAMGMLVDEGKVRWDDKVVTHLPDFQLYDNYVTRELRVKDLFTHNSGVGNADFLWVSIPGITPDEILHKMRYVEPSYTFRGGYTYQNIMYLAAAKIIEKRSGMTWERFMKERLYQPLGMKNTFPSMAYSKQYGNRSLAHHWIDGKIEVIEESSADLIAAAGASWSTADDIAKWVQFMLNEGKVGERALLKPQTTAEILKPQVIVPRGQFYPTTQLTKPNWTTYGLGWFQQDYKGEFLAFHTGSLAGRTAIIGLVPDKNFGFYFFGNLDHAELRHALMLKSVDLFVLEDDSRDWSKEVYELYAGFKKNQEVALKKRDEMRIKDTQPSMPLKEYAGTYKHSLFGTVKISYDEGKLKMYMSDAYSGTLSHWHYETFRLEWDKGYIPDGLIQFSIQTTTGNIDGVIFSGDKFEKVD